MNAKELDAKIKEHEKFSKELRLRVNKLLAERDPNRSFRYHEKRDKLSHDIELLSYEIQTIEDKLSRRKKQRDYYSFKWKPCSSNCSCSVFIEYQSYNYYA